MFASTPRRQKSPGLRRPKQAGRPPSSDGEVTRRRILEAAQRCFATHGYRETSNKIVADAADITPGTIYHYFESKQNLFLAVHDEIQRSVIGSVEVAVSSAATFADCVDEMLRALLALYIEHPDWIRFTAVVRTEARRNQEISAAQNDSGWRTLYRKLAEIGVANGEIDPRNFKAAQAVLAATVLGLSHHGIEATATTHVECVRGFSLLLRGLLVKPHAGEAGAFGS